MTHFRGYGWIQKTISLFFGSNENKKICFWYLLTFSMNPGSLKWGGFASIFAKIRGRGNNRPSGSDGLKYVLETTFPFIYFFRDMKFRVTVALLFHSFSSCKNNTNVFLLIMIRYYNEYKSIIIRNDFNPLIFSSTWNSGSFTMIFHSFSF